MGFRVVVATIIFCVVVIAYFQVDGALDALRRYVPNPEEIVQIGETSMRQIDAFCLKILPKVEPPTSLRSTLICEHRKRMVPALFVLASLTGWCASVWLLALRHKPDDTLESWMAFIASVLLGLISGLICYLILLAIPLRFLGASTPESATAFPLLAGLFLRTFFDRLPDLLSTIFDKLTGKGSGGSAAVGNGANLLALVSLTTVSLLFTSQVYGLVYYRCLDPKDKCWAFSEEDKAKCPECRKWGEENLYLSDVFESAQANQKSAGIRKKSVASNFFIAATVEELYKVDMTAGGSEVPPRASDIYDAPEKFGFRQLAEPQVGSIALFGNLAGIVVENEGKEGKVTIAYPSAIKGAIRFSRPIWLAEQKSGAPKYVVLEPVPKPVPPVPRDQD
jgi:hypothetical protein